MRSLVAVAVSVIAVLIAPVVAAAAPGELDRSFGTNGTATVPLPSGRSSAIAVLEDGRIVVGGSSGEASRGRFTLLRFLSSGRLDPSFGIGGVVHAAVSADDEADASIDAIVPLPDGGLVAVGTERGSTAWAMGVLRVDAAGKTVWTRLYQLGRPSANSRGVVDIGTSVSAAALAGDKILVSGTASGGTYALFDPTLARLNVSDGSLDRSFGEEGRVIAQRPAADCLPVRSRFAPFASFVVRVDGSIVAGGAMGCGIYAEGRWGILRAYTTSGEPLAGFETDPKGVRSFDWLRTAPDKTLTAVSFTAWNGAPAALMRLTSSGALADDPLLVGSDDPVVSVGVDVQSDGRLVSLSADRVVRFLPDGSLDASFGRAGAAPTGIRFPAAMALQPDGKIVVVGEGSTVTRLLGGVKAGVPVTDARRAAVRRRSVSIPIACQGPHGVSDCRGTVRMTATGRRHTSFTRARTFKVKAGGRTSLRIALNSTARRRIARAPHRRLTVRLAIGGPSGTKQRRLVLTAKASALR
jgi:uncharacterized delta-60 repeat protein